MKSSRVMTAIASGLLLQLSSPIFLNSSIFFNWIGRLPVAIFAVSGNYNTIKQLLTTYRSCKLIWHQCVDSYLIRFLTCLLKKFLEVKLVVNGCCPHFVWLILHFNQLNLSEVKELGLWLNGIVACIESIIRHRHNAEWTVGGEEWELIGLLWVDTLVLDFNTERDARIADQVLWSNIAKVTEENEWTH